MNSDNPLPCFCGKRATVVSNTVWRYVTCTGHCGWQGPHDVEVRKAIAKWNRKILADTILDALWKQWNAKPHAFEDQTFLNAACEAMVDARTIYGEEGS